MCWRFSRLWPINLWRQHTVWLEQLSQVVFGLFLHNTGFVRCLLKHSDVATDRKNIYGVNSLLNLRLNKQNTDTNSSPKKRSIINSCDQNWSFVDIRSCCHNIPPSDTSPKVHLAQCQSKFSGTPISFPTSFLRVNSFARLSIRSQHSVFHHRPLGPLLSILMHTVILSMRLIKNRSLLISPVVP